jgi:hypothetical protein
MTATDRPFCCMYQGMQADGRFMEASFARGHANWAMEVKGRLEMCIDLPAEEASLPS